MAADVEHLLPAMNAHLAGAGITPFNVWDLEFRWWRIYREALLQIVAELNKKGTARGK